jgi:YggT family protein
MGEWAMLFLIAVFALLTLSITALSWLIIAYALLSLVRADSDLSFVLEQMVNPLLNPIRRFIPLLGGIDLSPIALLLILQILEVVLRYVEQSI